MNELFQVSELLEDTESRRKIYGLLKTLFLKPPSEESLTLIRELNSSDYSEDAPDLAKGLKLLRKGAHCDPEELALEHTRLFIGPYRLPAPPYESVYRTTERLVMQKPAIEVRKAYLEVGLEMQGIHTNPDDHISAELEFMEYLCDKTASSLKNVMEAVHYVELQKRFIHEHLSKWVPAFSNDIVKSTKQDFYRGAALLLQEFIASEEEYLSHQIDESPG